MGVTNDVVVDTNMLCERESKSGVLYDVLLQIL